MATAMARDHDHSFPVWLSPHLEFGPAKPPHNRVERAHLSALLIMPRITKTPIMSG